MNKEEMARLYVDMFNGIFIESNSDDRYVCIEISDECKELGNTYGKIYLPRKYIQKSEDISKKYAEKNLAFDVGDLFLLLVLCHELSHIIYGHGEMNTIETSKNSEFLTEFWADFCGGILFIFFKDALFCEIFEKKGMERSDFDQKVVCCCGYAIEELGEIFVDSPSYPKTQDRMNLIVLGILSGYGRLRPYRRDRFSRVCTEEELSEWRKYLGFLFQCIIGNNDKLREAVHSHENITKDGIRNDNREIHFKFMKTDSSRLHELRDNVKRMLKFEFCERPELFIFNDGDGAPMPYWFK